MTNVIDDLINDIVTDNKDLALEQELLKNSIEKVDKDLNKTDVDKIEVQLPEKLLNKTRRYLDIMSTKNDKLKLNMVEFKVAQELFALLPEYINKIESSKLTKLPSETNSKLLNNQLNKYLPIIKVEVMSDITEKFEELNIYISEVEQYEKNINLAIQTFVDSNKTKFDLLEEELLVIVSNKTNIDARTVNLYDLYRLLNSMDYKDELYRHITSVIDESYTIDKDELTMLINFITENIYYPNSKGRYKDLFTIYDLIDLTRKLKGYNGIKTRICYLTDIIDELKEYSNKDVTVKDINRIEHYIYSYENHTRYINSCKYLNNTLDKPNCLLDKLQKLIDILYKLLS